MTSPAERLSVAYMTDALHGARARFAQTSSASGAGSAFRVSALDRPVISALAASTLVVRSCLVRLVCFTRKLAQVESVVLGNLSPAFSCVMHGYNVVEALPGRVGQRQRY